MPVETMNIHTDITPDFISRAVDEVRNLKPDYGLLLGLYESMFIEQENSRKAVHLADYTIPAEVLAVKIKEKFPLVEPSRFSIDSKAAGDLFVRICGILEKADNGVSESVRQIGDAVRNNAIDTGKLFPAFLGEDESLFESLEKEFKMDPAVLTFVVYNSLKPSLAKFAEMVSGHLDREEEWDKGYCPVCGSRPELSIFEENGRRSLLCGFCGHRWRSKRVFCPFCENTDHETLRYYEVEDEEEYRVDVCDRCKGFIKTVDIKKLSRPLYLPLECITTPYIDVKFREMGYTGSGAIADR